MQEQELEILRFPIGRFKKPDVISKDLIRQWMSDIESFPSRIKNEVVHLSDEQLEYAYFDCIYLAQVHSKLLALQSQVITKPETEDLSVLSQKYTEVEQQKKLINSEFDYLQERLKKAMQIQNVSETEYYQLSGYERKSVKVKFTELVRLVENEDIDLDFTITLTEKLQKELGRNLEQLDVDIEKTSVWRLITKSQEEDVKND